MKRHALQSLQLIIRCVTPRTKFLCTLALIALLTVSSGYASGQAGQTEAPDGFYVGADTAPSYALPIPPSDGGPAVTVQIRENGAFIPKHFIVSAADQIPGNYFVQVSGQGTKEMSDLPGIVIVANHKAYFGVAKRVGSSATVSLLLDNREEAEVVASMLEKRFSLPPSPIGLPTTNPAPNEISVQDLYPSTNWHWDQAMADALCAKANRDQDNKSFSAYSRMMLQARVNGMPEPPSQFPFPNVEGYAHHPPPDYVNFYCINDHSPNYLLCQYDVDEKHYDTSNESVWFKAALKQIRRSSPKKFPPIKWIAVMIYNRGDYKDENTTFEQCSKVGAIFKAKDVFDSSRKFSQLITDAKMDRHPFKYDQIQPTPGDTQRWLIVERHAATNQTISVELK